MTLRSTAPDLAQFSTISVCLFDHVGRRWCGTGLHSKRPFGLAKRLQQPDCDEESLILTQPCQCNCDGA